MLLLCKKIIRHNKCEVIDFLNQIYMSIYSKTKSYQI